MINDHLLDETFLLLRLSEGDQDAFEKLYGFYSSRIYCKLLRLLKSEFLAQEMLQEVFMKIWEKRQSIDTTKSFRSYLFCITVNKCYDFFRKAIKDKKLHNYLMLTGEYQSNIEETLVSKEKNGALYQAISLLPPKRREIFTLCKLKGKSYIEVSQQLGVSTSTVSDHIVKAKNFIRGYLTSKAI